MPATSMPGQVAADDERRRGPDRRPRAVGRAGGRRASSRSTVSRVPPAGRWYGRCRPRRSSRRTPPRRGGAGRPAPGAGRSGARRGGAPPRARERRIGAPPPRGARARARAGSPGPRRRPTVASQPASAWSDAPEPLGGLDQRDRRRSARCPRSAPARRGPWRRRRRRARPRRRSQDERRPLTSGRPGRWTVSERQAVRQAARASNAGNS